MKKIILSLILINSLFSTRQAYAQNTSDIGTGIWMNIKYIKCLENKLPCECEKLTETFFTAKIDTNKKSNYFGVSFLKYTENEFNQLDIKKISGDLFVIYKDIENPKSIIGNLNFKIDTLIFTDVNNNKSIFSKSSNIENTSDIQYFKQNAIILNNSFTKRKYLPLNKILKEDSLNCFCNKELGNINLIFNQDKAWIIEQKKNKLLIYIFLNNKEGKTVPPKIIKKMYKSFIWRSL